MPSTAAVILLISISTHGYWIGGRSGTVSVTYNAPAASPEAALTWELRHGTVRVQHGEVRLAARSDDADDDAEVDPDPSTITIDLPDVRARTVMRFMYRLRDGDGGAVIDSGERPLHVFPDDLLRDVAERLSRPLVIIETDAGGDLSRALADAEIEHLRVDRATQVALPLGQVILVAPGTDGVLAPVEQAALADLAAAGAGVVIFEQQADRTLMGRTMLRRPAPERIHWQVGHPLLRGFTDDDLERWPRTIERDVYALVGTGRDVRGKDSPEASGAIATIPMAAPEAPGLALITAQTIGRGQIVLVQLPLDDWRENPRARQVLANALDFAAAPVLQEGTGAALSQGGAKP